MDNYVENQIKDLAELVATMENGDASSIEGFVKTLLCLKIIDIQDVYDINREYDNILNHWSMV